MLENTIDLDKYEARGRDGGREIRRYPPGDMACADGKLFVGQVFSEFLLVVDIETQSVVKRVMLPGGGEGAVAASADGRTVFFASNKTNSFFVVDAATYGYDEVAYPPAEGAVCACSLTRGSRFCIWESSVAAVIGGRRMRAGTAFSRRTIWPGVATWERSISRRWRMA